MIIVLQESGTNFLDGEEVGPSQDVHVWVAIEGPRAGTVIPVIGAQSTLGTMTWFKLFGGSTHPQVRSAFGAAGVQYEPIESLSLTHSGSDIRGELVVDPESGFSWSAAAEAPWATLVGVNHDFYARGRDGGLVCTQVQALLKARAWASKGTLEIRGSVVPEGVLPAGSHAATVNSYDPIWIRAAVNLPVPE